MSKISAFGSIPARMLALAILSAGAAVATPAWAQVRLLDSDPSLGLAGALIRPEPLAPRDPVGRLRLRQRPDLYSFARRKIVVEPAQPVQPVQPVQPGLRPAQPFTPEWYAYCSARYRSFERYTGMYTTFAGQRQLCR